MLKQLLSNSVAHVLCDPPYEIDFARKLAGQSWDWSGVAFDVDLWAECSG